MVKKLVVANFKSHKNSAECLVWLDEMQKKSSYLFDQPETSFSVAVAPPAVCIPLLSTHPFVTEHSAVSVAIQDVSSFPAGSYTGAISTFNLSGLGVKYAILGHSERRQYFHETNIDVANKVRECLENEITPIVCVDESYLTSQAVAIDAQYRSRCVVAYEPLAAIGSGENSTAEEITPVIATIKQQFGVVPVLYGGSVTEDNMFQYRGIVDGFLIGTASLEAAHFATILQQLPVFSTQL